jgi:hypothetical protein
MSIINQTMHKDWSDDIRAAIGGLVLDNLKALSILHALSLITTLWTLISDQSISQDILLHSDNAYQAGTMGALLSIPLLAVPSMGTVCQHKHLMEGRR